MKIKKMYQGTIPENKIMNTKSDSKTDVYSCDYLNGKILYENSNGSAETIILSDNKNNYKYLEIYGVMHGKWISKKILASNTTLHLEVTKYPEAKDVLQFFTTDYTLEETQIIPEEFMYSYSGDYFGMSFTTNYCYITKVVGYK